MSINLFNRPKLGPGLGRIEVFDLSYVLISNSVIGDYQGRTFFCIPS